VQSLAARLRWIRAANTFSSAVAQTLVSRVAMFVLNFGMGVAVARFLGPVGRGEIGAVNLWPLVACGVLTLGIPTALRYEIRRRPDGRRSEMFSAALLLGLGLGVLAAGIGYFVLPYWLVRYSPAIISFARLMILFAPQIMLLYVVQGFLEARGDFAGASRIAYVPQTMTLAALIGLHGLHALTPFSAALCYAVPPAILTIGLLYGLRASIRIPRTFVASGRTLLRYGLRAYGLDVLLTLSGQIDQALVVGLLSATSFGLYVVAINITRTVLLLSGSLNAVLFPRASSLEQHDAIGVVNRAGRLIFASTAALGILLAIALPILIPLAYGKAYAQDGALVRVLTAEAVLTATTSTFLQAFMSTGRPGIVTILQTLGIATTVPLMLFLIPRFGINGAAYALLISTALRLCLVLISYPMFLHQEIPRLLIDSADVRYLYGKLRAAA
jgi:O-antigen/teichoic acid export membrane protein